MPPVNEAMHRVRLASRPPPADVQRRMFEHECTERGRRLVNIEQDGLCAVRAAAFKFRRDDLKRMSGSCSASA